MLTLDWLQLSIIRTTVPEPGLGFTAGKGYTFDLTDKKTINFNKLWEVKQDGIPIAWITEEPRLEWMDKTLMIIKFDNSWLHDSFIDRKVSYFLINNGLAFKGFTRLDVAWDFNKFDNGMHPVEFIREHLAGNFRKTDKTKIHVNGSNHERFAVEYIRWGTGNSDLSYYLYNKTIEMRDVKHKTHIAEGWLKNNLDMTDVWRLEFRIKSQHKMIVDNTTGESKTLQEYGLELLSFDNMQLLFQVLYTKYFDFRKNSGDTNITRNERIPLFTQFRAHNYFIRRKPRGDVRSNRMEKIFIKMLCEEMERLCRYYPDGFYDHEYKNLIGLVGIKIAHSGLRDWAYNSNFVPTEVFKSGT